ncbi:PREDICTED: non-specific lipid-transfer protein 2-like [Fragaria vesca subsp. vesca]|uniref:non-specific lipid-transfer protein 2-like n=1 Tax=Fragaria vesca subsp. vesca TaxID=101020 RepID=UPI0002C3307F|nr:PREDICTED: non-specific lipid-transfer protein 2-like [Fragaria vesca subsp. vesca]
MTSCSMSLLAFGVVIMVLMISSCPANGLTCDDTARILTPCQDFLVGSGPPTPSTGCCGAMRNLVSRATSTQVRRDLCGCMKQIILGFHVDVGKLQFIVPQYCKVKIPVPLDPNADCSKVPF